LPARTEQEVQQRQQRRWQGQPKSLFSASDFSGWFQ
jgi:hypothetical protein